MSHYVHQLTELELACGVTLADVARELPRVMIRDSGATVVVDATLSPALANSVARASFGPHPHKLSHIQRDLGLAVYILDTSA